MNHERRFRTTTPSRLVAALALILPMLAHAACKVESVELPVKMVGSRAVATVGINGTSVPLTVDSGAFFSMITDATAEQLKLRTKKNPLLRVEGISGRAETRMTTVEKLQFLKGEVTNVEFIVGGNDPGAGTMGLMGRNILSIADTEYDLAHGAIRFLFPNDDCAKSGMAYWAGTTPVTEVELVDDYKNKLPSVRARVKLNGKEVTALFDTGATTVVSLRAAARAGVEEAAMKPAGFVYGVGKGTSKAWTAEFDTFQIGGEVIRGNRLRVADFDLGEADLLLGIDFFLSHRLYISNQQSRIFITYNGGPVFALDRAQTAKAASPDGDPPAGATQLATADQYARRGAASSARRDFDSALADLDRACELEPTSAALFAQRGQIQQALRHPQKALEDFDQALSLDPAEVDARFRRAGLRIALKDRDGAKADLDALDRLIAPQAQMRLPMSNLYQTLEQPAQAIVQLDRWLPSHQNEITRFGAYNSRCWARLMLGSELDKALDDCDEAVDGDATNWTFLDSRGWVHLRIGKYGKAIADFDRSIELHAANPFSLYGRGLAKARMGDVAQGDADLAAARRLQADIDAKAGRIGLAAAKP